MANVGRSGWEQEDVSDGGFWDSSSGCTNSAAAGRSGNRGLRVSAGFNFVAKQFKPNGTTDDCFGRVALRNNTDLSGQAPLIIVQDSGTGQDVFQIRGNTDDTLELWKGGGTPAQIGSDSPAVSGYGVVTWEYDQSTATVTAYLDGTSFASGTVDASHDNASTLIVGIFAAVTGEWDFDDVAWNDQTGTVETGLPDWRGKLVQLLVNAAGDNAMGVRGGTDTGSDFGQLIQLPPDDITTYYALDANNDILDLQVQTAVVPSDATVKLIQVNLRHSSESAAQMSYQLRIKSQASGTLDTGSVVTHNDTAWKTNGDDIPRVPSLTSYADPQSGGPWTATLIDTPAQIGVIAPDAAPDCRFTSLWATVEYLEAGFQPAWARAHNQLLYDGGPLVY
jgi:hypothetical protein